MALGFQSGSFLSCLTWRSTSSLSCSWCHSWHLPETSNSPFLLLLLLGWASPLCLLIPVASTEAAKMPVWRSPGEQHGRKSTSSPQGQVTPSLLNPPPPNSHRGTPRYQPSASPFHHHLPLLEGVWKPSHPLVGTAQSLSALSMQEDVAFLGPSAAATPP